MKQRVRGVGAVRVKQRGGVVRQRRDGWRVRQRGRGGGQRRGVEE